MPTCSICRLGTAFVHAWQRDLDTARAERDEARSEVVRLTAERDAAVGRVGELGAERDAAVVELMMTQDERDALRAEVEAMRGVVEAATRLLPAIHERPGPSYPGGIVASMGIDGLGYLDEFVAALDALRARKVGG